LGFFLRGCRAVGIEDSYVFIRSERAKWKLISNKQLSAAEIQNLFRWISAPMRSRLKGQVDPRRSRSLSRANVSGYCMAAAR
jgi:hypothetical protein